MMTTMAAGTPADRERLGTAIRYLREDAQLSVDRSAVLAGDMSPVTWQRVEDGKPVRGMTFRGVESTLGLRRGLLNDILRGTADWGEIESSGNGGRPQGDEHLPQQVTDLGKLSQEEKHAFELLAAGVAQARRDRAKHSEDHDEEPSA